MYYRIMIELEYDYEVKMLQRYMKKQFEVYNIAVDEIDEDLEETFPEDDSVFR